MPPDITFPLEQFTILIKVANVKEAGVLPIAVTFKLKLREASAFEVNST